MLRSPLCVEGCSLNKPLAGSAIAMAFPAWASKEGNKSLTDFRRHLAEKSPAEEAYWEMVKKQFPVSGHTMMVNAANLCPSPHFVNEQVNASFAGLEKTFLFNIVLRFRKSEAWLCKSWPIFSMFQNPKWVLPATLQRVTTSLCMGWI